MARDTPRARLPRYQETNLVVSRKRATSFYLGRRSFQEVFFIACQMLAP